MTKDKTLKRIKKIVEAEKALTPAERRRLKVEIDKHTAGMKEQEDKRAGLLKMAQRHAGQVHKYLGDDNLDAPEYLAALIASFDLENPKDIEQIYLEWTVDTFVGNKVIATLPDIEAIHARLVAGNHTEDNPFDYNDLDNSAFYFPCADKDKLVFVIETQCLNFLYIRELPHLIPKAMADELPGYCDNGTLHIRQYFDQWEIKDKYDSQEAGQYKRHGMKHAIIRAHYLCESFADDFKGNRWPRRLSLATYKKRGFKLGYGDCRDRGYVLSLERWPHRPTVDRALSEFSLASRALFEISSIQCYFEEDS